MNPLCIYHGNCADGFTSAWIVRAYFLQRRIKVDFHAGIYQDPPPDVAGRDVLLVDFSYKQAVLHDNQFGPALTNLAWLYHQNGDLAAAEEALQLALQRDEGHETANHALYQLLKSQGRDAEARVLRATLDANRKNDPYYWINRGQEYLQQGSTDRAVAALERAQELTTGFAEVHRYLAQAYLLLGKTAKAQEQLTLLAHIDQQDPTLPTLQSKLLSKKLRY